MQLLNLSHLAPLLMAVSLMEATVDRSLASNLSTVAAPDRAVADDEKSKKNKNDGKDDKGPPGKKSKADDKKGGESRAADVSATPADCRLGGSSVALADLPEASGLSVSRRTPGILWSHLDSGPPVLFALDTRGSVKGKVRVEGVKTDDWEDVAVGSCGSSSCVYIADIGDNQASRKGITVYRVPEPLPTDRATQAAEAFHGTFPDGPKDAEALFVSGAGELFVVTKGDAGPVALYRFPASMKAGASAKLQKISVLKDGKSSNDQWITGASTSPDGKWVALRTHNAVFFYAARMIAKGDLSGPLFFDVTALKEPRGEGVALGANGAIFLAGEGGKKGASGTFAAGVCKLPLS